MSQGLAEVAVYSLIVRDVRNNGLTSTEVAEITGVKERQVQNWAAGTSRPAPDSRYRLLEIHYIVDQLKEVYTPEGVEIWLHGRNRTLGGQLPIDLLRDGQFETVRLAVERLQVGAM